MNNNLDKMNDVLNYIEDNLNDEHLDLDTIARRMHYSKYHLHRLFTSVVGFPVHHYILRRRLSEAASQLVYTDESIINIALNAGYVSQRSFSKAFKKLYKSSPNTYRKTQVYLPLQLRYKLENNEAMQKEHMLEIKTVQMNSIQLIGYRKNTKNGIHVIGQCWRQLHKNKHRIENRIDDQFLIGVNDYSTFEQNLNQPAFYHFAGAQVSSFTSLPKKMETMTLPPSNYVVFSFRGKNEDSLQSIVDYVYKEWFPLSTSLFNENNLYDFCKYGEEIDNKGMSDIEYWVPII